MKPAPKHLLVRWDGYNEDHRVLIDDIRPETPEDVAKREHKERMATWSKAMPEVEWVNLRLLSHWGWIDVTGADLRGTLHTPAEFRDAAREMTLLADWFEKRPEALARFDEK